MTFSYNLVMPQSADFLASFQINDANNNSVNLASLTIESQMRHEYVSNVVAIQFTCNGYPNGYLTISAPASNTMVVNAGSYVYDVMFKDAFGNISRPVQGVINVTPAVTVFV